MCLEVLPLALQPVVGPSTKVRAVAGGTDLTEDVVVGRSRGGRPAAVVDRRRVVHPRSHSDVLGEARLGRVGLGPIRERGALRGEGVEVRHRRKAHSPDVGPVAVLFHDTTTCPYWPAGWTLLRRSRRVAPGWSTSSWSSWSSRWLRCVRVAVGDARDSADVEVERDPARPPSTRCRQHGAATLSRSSPVRPPSRPPSARIPPVLHVSPSDERTPRLLLGFREKSVQRPGAALPRRATPAIARPPPRLGHRRPRPATVRWR